TVVAVGCARARKRSTTRAMPRAWFPDGSMRAPARAHLERLRCRENNRPRVGLRRIAQLSGVPRRTLQLILYGQPQIHPYTERRRRLIEEHACSNWTTCAVFSPGQSAFQLFEPLIDLRPA